MKLSEEIKRKIEEEYTSWEHRQYANNTKEQRDALGQFFTPPSISIQMIEQFDCDSLAGKTILDPTIGAGGLIAACIIAGADPKLCYGNEFDENILKECKARLMSMGVPEVNLHLGDATIPECVMLENFDDKYNVKVNKKTHQFEKIISVTKWHNPNTDKEDLW